MKSSKDRFRIGIREIVVAFFSMPLLAMAAVMEAGVWLYSQLPDTSMTGWIARGERDQFAPYLRTATTIFLVLGLMIVSLVVNLSHDAVAQSQGTIDSQRTQIASLQRQKADTIASANALATTAAENTRTQATADASVKATAVAQATDRSQTCGSGATQRAGSTKSGSWVIVARQSAGSDTPCAVISVRGGDKPFPMGNRSYIHALPLGDTLPVTILQLGPNTVVFIGSHDEVQTKMCASPGLKPMVQAHQINVVSSSLPDFVCK